MLAPRGGRALVPTGLAVAIPPGYGGFVLPRSGLALKHGVTVLNAPGLIDPQYRGEVKVLLVNTDPDDRVRDPPRRPDRAARDRAGRVRRVAGGRRARRDRRATRSASGRPVADGPSAPVPLRRHRQGAASRRRVRATFARQVEALGFSTFFMPDHFVDHPLAPMPGIVDAAAATTTLRVGTLVLGNDYKHPVVLATEAATVDLLSGGRLELGVGAGLDDRRLRARGHRPRAGERAHRAARRVAHRDQGPHGAASPFTFHGQHYRVDGLDGEPKPVQQPHPPIIVGGGGPKVLAVAAKHAQIVGINANLQRGTPEHPETVRSLSGGGHRREARAPARRGGRPVRRPGDPDAHRIRARHRRPGRDRRGDGRRVRRRAVDVALETPAALVGTIDEMCADLEARRERWQMSYVVVPEEFVDVFAPVVARLAGT